MIECKTLSESMPGARQVRVLTLTEDELLIRAREAAIFAYPRMPRLIARLVRAGRFDGFLAGTRQALRDIEKPTEFLTLEARAAWVWQRTLANELNGVPDDQREKIANALATAIRVGTRD